MTIPQGQYNKHFWTGIAWLHWLPRGHRRLVGWNAETYFQLFSYGNIYHSRDDMKRHRQWPRRLEWQEFVGSESMNSSNEFINVYHRPSRWNSIHKMFDWRFRLLFWSFQLPGDILSNHQKMTDWRNQCVKVVKLKRTGMAKTSAQPIHFDSGLTEYAIRSSMKARGPEISKMASDEMLTMNCWIRYCTHTHTCTSKIYWLQMVKDLRYPVIISHPIVLF